MYGVFGVLFAFILLALGLIQMFTYRATPEAQETWNIAAFEQKNNWTHFEVTGEKKGTLLFYTGALVEPQAYAKLADGLAKEGIEVYIISSQLNLPVLDNGTMATIVKEEHLDKVFIGVTEEIAGQEIYELGHDTIPYQMPEGTRMGHVHLSARNSKETMEYLTTLLPVEDKFSVPSGSWIASGDYHHHLAVNQWGGPHLDVRVKNTPGLAYYTVETNDASVFKDILQKATVLATTVEKRGEKEVDITDNNGITVRVTLNN